MSQPLAPIEGPDLKTLIIRIADGQDLGAADAEAAFSTVMEGRATSIQIASLLVGLRVKGEAPTEVAGGVRALRKAMVPVEHAGDQPVVDTCGTGGGTFTTFNISTAAALVAAGAGVHIAKHGNRSFTSRSGSADVLEALGVDIELPPDAMAAVLDETGIVFMFAPLLHPAMRHVAPVRRELGMSTLMNVLGPLTNPAGARRQVIGVQHAEQLELVAGGLRELQHERALVVHGHPGMDELSPLGPSDVVELRDGALVRSVFDPAVELGWKGLDAAEIHGGSPDDNATIIRDVFEGRRAGAARAAITLNAGAAIYIAGIAGSLEEGVGRAESAIDAGAATTALARLREATRRAAGRST